MRHQWLNFNFAKLRKYLLCTNKTKITISLKDRNNVLFVTYTIIQSITSSKMCSLHLTRPSAHTLGAVDTHTHTHLEQWTHTHTHGAVASRGAVWGFGALLKGLTSVVDNSCRESNPEPRVTSPTLYSLGHGCP